MITGQRLVKRRDVGVDSRSRVDPVEAVYNRRERGLGIVAVASGAEMHAHAGCWFMLAAGAPARLVVSVPREFPAADLVARSGRFSVSLPTVDQAEAVRELYRGHLTADEFPPGMWAWTPAGQPVLRGATSVFDCVCEGRRELRDAVILWGPVEHAGGERGGDNLTAHALEAAGGIPEPILPVEPWAWTPKPMPAVRFGERPDHAYRRRRWGLMALVTGTPLHWAGALTSGVIQVSHEPPEFLWLVPPGSAVAKELAASETWSGAIATEAVLALTRRSRVDATDLLEWADGWAVIPGALGLFAGTVTAVWDIGLRLAVLGEVTRYRDDPGAGANITTETWVR
jgi:flavin reductase (DIM6/NTAB) family NADH-FMN oxidoreductase RutF